jgi:rhodanese-related sulfurtransferase
LLSDPPRDFYLVDTRTWFEYIEGHIPGAIHIYYKKIARKPPTDKRDAIIFVYCLRGIRSAEAAEKLREAGFTRVLNWGGIEDWPYEAIVGGWPGRLYD